MSFFFYADQLCCRYACHPFLGSSAIGSGEWHCCPVPGCFYPASSLEYLDLHQKLVHLGFDPALCGLPQYQESSWSATGLVSNGFTTSTNNAMLMNNTVFPNNTLLGDYRTDGLVSTSIPGHSQGNPNTDVAFEPTSTPLNPHNSTNHVTCAFCNKAYARTADLNRHLRTHDSNAKKHGCPAPGCKYAGSKGFLRRDKLRDHVRARHPGMSV